VVLENNTNKMATYSSTLKWIDDYCDAHDGDISGLKYASRNYELREIKDMVKQLGIETVVEEIGTEEIQVYLRNKKLNQIKDGLR
jgi:hypothetical protein